MNLNATLWAQMIVFFILAWVTMTWVWPPIMRALDERMKKIADGLSAADQGKQFLADAQRRIDAEKEEAKIANQARIADAERQATSLIEQGRKAAEAEKARILAQAKEEAAQEMRHARDTLRQTVGDLVVKGAEQILKREINPNNHADLLNQIKSQL